MNIFQQLKEKKVLDKDGKVDALGPYGRMKLTGREIATYFRKNKVKDKEIRKAVEVALDLGGADSIARKEIKKFYGNKILKSKEVQNALKFANEETFREQLEEDYKKVMKMYPRDKDWKKLINKHKRDIDKFRKNNKDLPKKVEDDLISWALDAGEISNKGEVEDFIDDILNESTLSEGKNLMPDIQKIVDTKGAAKVGGIMIDMFTASMINQIYNKVNDSNKKKMENSNISKLVDLAQRMMQKMGDNLEERFKSSLAVNPKNVKKFKPMLQKYADKFGVELEFGIGGKMPSVVQIKSKSSGAEKNFMSAVSKDRKLMSLMDEVEEAANPAQQAAIAISKKEKAGKPGYDKEGKSLKNKKESVMDAYREMWENGYITEEVADITVDPKNRINSGQQQGYHGMEIAKQARRFGLKSAVMHKHIRIKGPKKKVNDFLRVVIGKSRYGDPTEKDMTTPQIDKMLNKGMK